MTACALEVFTTDSPPENTSLDKGMTPVSEMGTTGVSGSSARAEDGARTFECFYDRSESMEIIRQLKEDQARCAGDISSIFDRLCKVELLVQATSEMVDHVSTSSRAPPPGSSAARLARPSPEPKTESAASGDQVICAQPNELNVLKQGMDDLHAVHTASVAKLEAALDAARTGIARLARELHYEREDRRKTVSDVSQLAEEVSMKVCGPALFQAQRTLKASTLEIAEECNKKLRMELDARLQMLSAEIRGEAARPEVERSQHATMERLAVHSLKDWLPESADGDISATTSMLCHLRVFEYMTCGDSSPEQMVSRPTTRFVHRVVVAVKHATGYPQGILEDWPEPLDAKLDFVKRVWESISTTLSLQDTEFKAVDVLHCTNRQRTRRLLQLLAIAAAKERGLQRRTPRPLLMPPSLPLHTTPAQEPPQCPSPTATSVCWH